MPEILFKEESYKIVGLCMDVHKTLGMGFKEATYKEALELESAELKLGMVINFGAPSLQFKRIVF